MPTHALQGAPKERHRVTARLGVPKGMGWVSNFAPVAFYEAVFLNDSRSSNEPERMYDAPLFAFALRSRRSLGKPK